MLNEFESQIMEVDGQITGITAADLLLKNFPEPRWAIPGLLSEGVNLLAGKPKKGKSILALNIGLSIAFGSLALGKVPVEKGNVIYLPLEDTERRLQSRLKQMLAYSDKEPHGLYLFTKWPRMNEGGLEHLENKINEITNVRLIIIDTLQKFRKPAKGNGNLYSDDYETVSKIKELADRLGVCILLIHHLRKMESDDIFDTLSGSLGLTGGVDGILVLQNSKGNTTLHITGRDIEEKSFALSLDSRLLTWQLLGEASEIQSTTSKQLIFDAIKNSDEALSPKDICYLTGVKLHYIKKVLPSFLTNNLIIKKDKGKYIFNGTMGTNGTDGTMGTTGTTS